MVGIVQTNGNEFTDMADGATHAGFALDQRQRGGLDAREFGQGLVAQMLWRDVCNDLA